MTPIELHQIFQQNNWQTDSYSQNKGYLPPEKIRYALVASLGTDNPDSPYEGDYPWWVMDMANRKANADKRNLHRYDAVRRNKSIAQLLKEYHTKGKKVQARVELKQRIAYASFAEQKKVLCTFLDNASVDRLFALRHLETHWDDYFAPFVEKVWHLFHEMESARVITHHFPQDFIETHQTALAKDYLYLQVRLRLPTTAPIDRSRLSSSAYLYLCARQNLPVADAEAEQLFYQTVLDASAGYYFPKDDLCDIPAVSSMVWSLGMLRKTDILLRFIEFQKNIWPLVCEHQWDEIKIAFGQLNLPLDYSRFEQVIQEREYRQQYVDNYPTVYPNTDPSFDWDSYVDEHVEAEKNSNIF